MKRSGSCAGAASETMLRRAQRVAKLYLGRFPGSDMQPQSGAYRNATSVTRRRYTTPDAA